MSNIISFWVNSKPVLTHIELKFVVLPLLLLRTTFSLTKYVPLSSSCPEEGKLGSHSITSSLPVHGDSRKTHRLTRNQDISTPEEADNASGSHAHQW